MYWRGAVPDPLYRRLFVPDNPEVMTLGATVLRIVAVAQPIMGMNHVLAGSLRVPETLHGLCS